MTISSSHVHRVNPNVELCAEAQHLRESKVHKNAVKHLGTLSHAVVTHVSAPGGSIHSTLSVLAGSTALPDLAVANVLLLAVMLRFAELLQRERERLGYSRQWISHGPDLLAAIHQCVVDRDDLRLIALLARESREFSRFVDDEAIRLAVLRRLSDFKTFAIEAHENECGSSLNDPATSNRLTASAKHAYTRAQPFYRSSFIT